MSMKIAIVGTGNVARQNYIPFLSGESDVTLGYWNRSREKADAVAEKYGGVVFDSLEALAQWNPDSALVLTSEKARYEVAGELVERGVRRLFLEKPLVAAAGQAHVDESDFYKGRDLLDRARARGCETAMIFNYRFFDQVLLADKIAEERSFGNLIGFTALVHYACWSHCLDLIHHFGGGVAEISALLGNVERHGQGIAAADLAAAMRLENGATGTAMATAGLKFQHPLFEMVFTFEGGRMHIRDLDGNLEVLDGERSYGETISLVRNTSRWDQYSASFKKSLQAYLDSLRSGDEPPVPGIDGLRELQVEAAFRRSIAQRRPVAVQEEFPLYGALDKEVIK